MRLLATPLAAPQDAMLVDATVTVSAIVSMTAALMTLLSLALRKLDQIVSYKYDLLISHHVD